MTAANYQHAHRRRCTVCRGRRVVVDVLLERIVPCPSCNHHDPRPQSAREAEPLADAVARLAA